LNNTTRHCTCNKDNWNFRTTLSLKEIGALLTTVNGVNCKDDGDLTVLGELIAALPVDVRLGKLIVYGHLFNVLEEAVIIAAGLSGKSLFTTPLEKKLQYVAIYYFWCPFFACFLYFRAYANKLVWADRTFSDCFAVFIAYNNWTKKRREGFFQRALPDGTNQKRQEWYWCQSRYLQLKVKNTVFW
jgi:ATP-dependent RNA helicase TDRD9